MVTVSVRRRGERKAMNARDLVPRTQFHARDRRVLEHTREFGTGRKAVFALGVEASLTLEAIRVHGGVSGGLEATPRVPVRGGAPARAARAASIGDARGRTPFDELTAVWVGGGET